MPGTIADYLTTRLAQIGVKHIFAVPGDYVFGFLECVESSGQVARVGVSNELVAGYAADAYARTTGIGAVAVTYGVGAFSLLNAVAGSYVELLPVIVICGSPSNAQREIARTRGVLYHHTTTDLNADELVYKNVTTHATVISDAARAPAEIDRALTAALCDRRPVYIEITSDLWTSACAAPAAPLTMPAKPNDQAALGEAVADAWTRITSAKSPLILGGVLIDRLGLQREFQDLVAASGFPFTCALTEKSIVSESTPRFVGVFDGAGDEHVQGIVQDADCLLAPGTLITDHYLELVQHDYDKMIHAHLDGIRIGYHFYPGVGLPQFLEALVAKFKGDSRYPWQLLPIVQPPLSSPTGGPDTPVTYESFFQRIAPFLDDSMIVLADLSISLHVAPRLRIARSSGFVAQAGWEAIGYALGAAVGVGFASPARPIVIVGDGGFQMTCQAISTLVRCKQRAIVFVMNNGIYGLEQANIDPTFFTANGPLTPFNRLDEWDYEMLGRAMGAWATTVSTQGDLDAALTAAGAQTGTSLVQVRLAEKDLPPQMVRITAGVTAVDT